MNTSAKKMFLCLIIAGAFLYAYINQRNELTQLQLSLPNIERELRALEQQNIKLSYAIDRFESPLHLMELSRKPEYGHLKYPHLGEVILIDSYAREEDESGT